MLRFIDKGLSERVELETIVQFFRFCVVGVINVSVSFAVFFLVYNYVQPGEKLTLMFNALFRDSTTNVEIDGAVANIIGYVAGMVNRFALNKLWTFQVEANTLKQAHRFFILNMIGLAFSTIILYLFVDLWRFPYIPIWFASIILVMTINFLGNKYWTFSEQSQGTT